MTERASHHPPDPSPPASSTEEADYSEWRSPTFLPALQPGVVHLWRTSLTCVADHLQDYAQSLSSDELERATRFKFEHLRRRFVTGRGILRKLLGHYLAIAPAQIKFVYEKHGKPVLDPIIHPTSLRFNLSHSHDLALLAFTDGGTVGVDVEWVQPPSQVLALAKRFFTPQEYGAIAALPESLQGQAFFRLWTCKEAYLKATGEGIAGLQTVEVNQQPDGTKILCLPSPDGKSPKPMDAWMLRSFTPSPGYVGAIALTTNHPDRPQQLDLQTFHYPDSDPIPDPFTDLTDLGSL